MGKLWKKMNHTNLKKELLYLYFVNSLYLLEKRGAVDDYDVCNYSEHDFSDIGQYKLPLLDFARSVFNSLGGGHVQRNDNIISLFNNDGFPIYEFSFLVSESLTFSGTIGINEIHRDFGFSKHLDYLSIFMERYKVNNLFTSNNIEVYGEDSEELLASYIKFYDVLEEYFTNDPMSLYSLLSGIKKEYKVPDTTVMFSGDKYIILDMRKLKSHLFINEFIERVDSTSNQTSPMLKIEFDGNKILHIRTKMDKKNNKFKLRFFIETTSKFLNLFKTTRKL